MSPKKSPARKRKRTPVAKSELGVSAWIPATPEEREAIDAAAARDHRARGAWLLKVALIHLGLWHEKAA